MARQHLRLVGVLGRIGLVALIVFALVPAAAFAARVVYVSNGSFAGSNNVSALRINANGTLTAVAPPITTGGTISEGLAITPDASHVYVAVFGSNAVAGFNVNAASGALSTAPLSPYTAGFTTPLSVQPDPNGKFLFAGNHGGAFSIATSTIVAAGGGLNNVAGSPVALTAPSRDPFAGSVAPDGQHLYYPNENNNPPAAPETVSAYTVGATGLVSHLQTIGSGNLGVQSNPFGSGITPDGKFLYVSNPEDGANGTIDGFSVNANGTLTHLAGLPISAAPGSHPLNIAIAPDGKHLYVATRITNTVNAYTINATGSLTPIGSFPTGAADPAGNGKALALTPDGKRLYVSAGGTDDRVFGFNVLASGALIQINGGVGFLTGGNDPDLEAIAITPNQPPASSFTTAAASTGQASAFDASGAADSDGGTIATYQWDFGDGTSATGGPTQAHVYTQPGTYLASLRVTDDEGCSTDRIFTGKATLCNGSAVAQSSRSVTVPATPPDTPPAGTTTGKDTTVPRILSASVDPSKFAVDPRGPKETAVTSLVAKGTTLRYSLSEASRVLFTVDRKATGRKVGKSCKKQTRKNRKKKKCTLLTRQGRFAQESGSGGSIKRFSGRIGNKKLAVGSYQLTFDATDLAGNKGQPLVRTFKIVSR